MMFLECLPELISYLKLCYSNPSNPRLCIATFNTLTDKFPSFFKNNKNFFLIILELVFLEMVKLPEVIDDKYFSSTDSK